MAWHMLIESELPKELRTCAVRTVAVIRNRCFNNHTKQTPYLMLTGRRPTFSRIQKSGSVCYVYKKDKRKLTMGQMHRPFVTKQQTQSDMTPDDDHRQVRPNHEPGRYPSTARKKLVYLKRHLADFQPYLYYI